MAYNMNSQNPSQWQALIDAINSGGGGESSPIVEALGVIATAIGGINQLAGGVNINPISGLSADNVQSALNEIVTKLSIIGQIKTKATNSVEVPNNTRTYSDPLLLEPGLYILRCSPYIEANATGIRRFQLCKYNTTSSYADMRIPAASGIATNVALCTVIDLRVPTEVCVSFEQNSGSTLVGTAQTIMAVRIA